MLQTIPFIILYIFLFQKWKDNKYNLIINTIFYIYISAVIFLTLLPIDFTIDLKYDYSYSVNFKYGNLIPFNDFLLHRTGSLTGILLNVLMTVPFGIIYPLIKKTNIIKTTLFISLFSITIELLQLLTTIFLLSYRRFDITDIITNTIGGIIGYTIYKCFITFKKGFDLNE